MDRLEQRLYHLEQGFELQFRLGPTLQGKEVHVYTNYPEADNKFDRPKFHLLGWCYPNGLEDDLDKYCKLDLTVAGSYQYYFSCGDKEKVSGGYIVVDPVLRVGAKDDILPLDCISCQTYLAKELGPLDEWMDRLRVAKETGYNMIHFTPLQKLGSSDSCYSLADQLELNPKFSPEGRHYSWRDVADLVKVLCRDWNIACITDVVYNQTAADCEWIHQHPECGYNLVNTPYLKPAWLLDRALWHLSCEVAEGKYADQGVQALIQDEQNLHALRGILEQQVFSRLKLWEFLQVDVDSAVEQLKQSLLSGFLEGKSKSSPEVTKELKIIQDPQHRRFGNTLDIDCALDALLAQSNSPSDIQECCDTFRRKLEDLNSKLYQDMNGYTQQATSSILETVFYDRVAKEGPKLGPVTRKNPLCPRYFSFPFEEMTLEEEIQLMEQKEKACHFLAHDGFKKGKDPLKYSTEPASEVYLLRKLICQSDAIKLRYGEKPEDCPYLWDHMKTYTEMTAKIFCGIRLVNCQSTPLHVTQALLTAARVVRPNLYVIAKLLTGSQLNDNVFVNHLGITSLVRDITDSQQEADCPSLFGGEPVGAFVQPSLRPLVPVFAHTMFTDTSLESYSKEQSVYDCLPRSALVAMAHSAAGSIRGYDELLPHHIFSTREDHQYSRWNPAVQMWNQVSLQTGMVAGKLALNKLHKKLAAEGFTQVHVEQLGGDVVAVTRHCPSSHESVVAVLWRAIKDSEAHQHKDVPPIFIPCQIQEVMLEARTVMRKADGKGANSFGGLPEYNVEIQEHIQLEDSKMVKEVHKVSRKDGVFQQIIFENFTPGCIIIFRVVLESQAQEQLGFLRHHLIQFSPRYQTGSSAEKNTSSVLTKPLIKIMSGLTLADMNMLLYRCDAEERQEGGGCYTIPAWLPLNYGGLQGVVSAMADIRPKNELNHPLCVNLRQGDWMMDFISNRLLAKGGALREVGHWFEAIFSYLKHIPRYLVPCYFDAIIQGAYTTALETIFKQMSSFVQNGSSLVKQLALGSVQLYGVADCSLLPPISPELQDRSDEIAVQEGSGDLSLAAGLPHLCIGTFRCWGRDTFIALRGLMLLTGRHLEARNIILRFAGLLRYGLIPNRQSQAGSPRYNSRDAVWWWLQSVQEFCALVPDGVSILRCPVSRIFPTNVSEPQPPGAWVQPLYDVIQEVMQRHMQGIQFKETNTGPQSDSNTTNDGLHVVAGVDQSTGFVFGGNRFSCGTWMDKMGESEKAGNKGIPATPRDGSAIELVGLCKSAVRWLVKLNKDGHFPHTAVTVRRGDQTYSVSYEEWDCMIQENFEKNFYIYDDPPNGEEKNPELVHKRGIYKDCLGASSPWCDYQLRPNFPITMVVAPELFTVQKAWACLELAGKKLLGPLGIKTLDPDDMVYCGIYDLDLNNDNFNLAKGFNYHQGPEWVWPVGFFLRAKLYFAKKMGKEIYDQTVTWVKNILSQHAIILERSPWKGLPELTNENGQHCFSRTCQSHASSIATILEVLHDL